MINAKDVELMAPAGDFASLQSAINAGANSIYFGLMHLNMRANSASNFDPQDLKEIVKRCKASVIKTYLVVNTLLFDHDINVAKKLIDSAKAEGVDAVIAFDFAVLEYCNQIKIPVHASVQFSVSNYESLKFFSKLTNRVVLARELNLVQIKDIYKKIKKEKLMGSEGRLMEIEAFAHGALCIAQSGRCFMSAYSDNASANRGACRQNCRAGYKLTNLETGKEMVVKNQFIMSASDICTIDFLDQLLDAGISVLKIEGRGRSAEYVDTVISTYKKALTDITNKKYNKNSIKEYLNDLEKVFNRGLSKGNYYLGREIGEYNNVYGSKAKEKKESIGIVTNYFKNISVAEIKIFSGKLSIKNEVFIIGSKTGAVRQRVLEIRNKEKQEIKVAKKGDIITIPVAKVVRRNDKVYLIQKT